MAEQAETPDAAQDVRPQVARASGSRAVWIFAAILLAAGSGLFYALQMRRLGLENPSLTAPQPAENALISSPPALVIPPAADGYASGALPYGASAPSPLMARSLAANSFAPSAAPYSSPVAPPPAPASAPAYSPASPPAALGPAYAYQAPASMAANPDVGAGEDKAEKTRDKRVEAGTLRNPSTTVPQGSVIQAVMETALDSTRAGFARAIVSRDVMSFDGTRVLIPRGSKLFGEYQADVSLGQNRALIQWRRLTRPDGAIIDLDSPSADPLGRAGVRGRVNTHFFQRFSGAILQSLLDIGVRAATEEAAGDTVVVALPSSATQVGATSVQNQADIKPTLKIRQGASVSVFVARDLDFSSVGG